MKCFLRPALFCLWRQALRQALPDGQESRRPPTSFAISRTIECHSSQVKVSQLEWENERSWNGWMGRWLNDWTGPTIQSWEHPRLFKLKPGSHCASSWLPSPSRNLQRLWEEGTVLRGSLRFSIIPVVSFSPPKTTSKALDYMLWDAELSCSSSPCPPPSDTLS